jgi:transcriptional repressor NrdR
VQCPFCGVDEDRVIDSRTIGEGNAIRRRRKCLACGKRFTTYERPEATPRLCIKKDGSHELFSREKILSGMIKACHKRNISLHDLEGVAAKIESEIFEEYDSEVSTKVIGEKVSEALKGIDHVAFVRFASVYREFKDVGEFLKELLPLVNPTGLIPPQILSQVSPPSGTPAAGQPPPAVPRPARAQEPREPRGKKAP